MDLILDVKVLIASHDEEVWFWLYMHDEEFEKFTHTIDAIKLYNKLFYMWCYEETSRYYTESYLLLGKLHRMDGPAFISTGYYGIRINNGMLTANDASMFNAYEVWCQGGIVTRGNDLPAVINKEERVWYNNGKRHRDNDLPAIISDNRQVWYCNGKIHRDRDLPANIYYDTKSWYHRGKLHRSNDLPAIMSDDELMWYHHGKKHRDNDLPAHILVGEKKTKYKWWYYGKQERPNQLPI